MGDPLMTFLAQGCRLSVVRHLSYHLGGLLGQPQRLQRRLLVADAYQICFLFHPLRPASSCGGHVSFSELCQECRGWKH